MSEITKRVVTGVVVASILAVASAAPDWIANLSSSVYIHLTRWVSIPMWGLYVLVIIAMPTIIGSINFLIKTRFTSYQYDDFWGVKWRWSYIFGTPINIAAYCPIPFCDTKLSIYPDTKGVKLNIVLFCGTCNRVVYKTEDSWSLLLNKVERQIDRKIRNGEWKKAVKK